MLLYSCQHQENSHTQISYNPQKHKKASPSVLKAGARPWVKATARLLMWSVISSELAWLQQKGLQECGKNQCERDERKCVFISVGGAWFPLWSVYRPAPGWSCKRLNFRVTSVSYEAWHDPWAAPAERTRRLQHPVEYQQVEKRLPVCVFVTASLFITFSQMQLLITQWQSKDLNSLNDRTGYVRY